MKWILCVLMFMNLAASAQYAKEAKEPPKKDTVKKTVDTAVKVPAEPQLFYPDSLVIKVPLAYIPTLINTLNQRDDQIILGLYKQLLIIVGIQIEKQYVTKPPKKQK